MLLSQSGLSVGRTTVAPCDAVRSRIGGRLRERRRALGLTQEECAALIAMPRLSLTRIELGYRRIKLSELGTICETLGSQPRICSVMPVSDGGGAHHDRLYGSLPIHQHAVTGQPNLFFQ